MENSITIKQINLVNFKGLRNQTINFKPITNIYGDNGTGKTTLFDAFTWLLFGKDSTDRKDFEIKTLDKNNKVISKIDHEVSAIIDVAGVEYEIKRILKENWVKKRGSLESEFSGNITEYYWNGVPMQQKEYQTKVSQILDETVFKMITNPFAFNTLKWQDRRNVLVQIAGTISDNDLARGNAEYESVIAQLTNGKTLEDYRKQIAASIKKAKEDLKLIPTRIDEVSRSKPEAYNFSELRASLALKENEVKLIDNKIQDKNSAFDGLLVEINKKKSRANSLKSDIENIEFNANRESKQTSRPDHSVLNKLNEELKENEANFSTANNGVANLTSKKATIENQLKELEVKIAGKRTEWGVENAKEFVFDEGSCACPTCKRDFEAADIEAKKIEMLANFKAEKQSKLSEISKQGKSLGEEKLYLETEFSALKGRIENGTALALATKNEIERLTNEVTKLTSTANSNEAPDTNLIYESLLSKNAEYKVKKAELVKLEATIEDVPKVDINELIAQKSQVNAEIDEIKSMLRNEEQITSINNRIADLEKEESTLAQQIANVEKTQFTIENFNKLKIDTLEAKINSKFKFVNFRMFETQINGGESECCDALINGVPFSDANTASKYNAGIDIINTLCEFYNVTAPIFLDNRESVVNIIKCDSQLINLVVSEADKKLRVA